MAKSEGYTGLTRLINATRFSWQGLRAAARHEEAFLQELVASLGLVPLAFWLGETGIEKALLLGSWLLVLIVELLNSAIETAIDRIGNENHELSGRAKDQGSAAVLIALFNAVAVWILVIFN